MSVRSFTIVLLALIFGGSLAFGVNKFLKQDQATAAPVDLVPVLIAAQDIGVHTSLTEDMFQIEHHPSAKVQLGSLQSMDEAAGRLTLFALSKGEAISTAKLSGKGAGGIGAAIPKGMRLFTILTPNLTTSVGGFIRQGSKVDVLLTVRRQGTEEPAVLQNLEVFAVDQRLDAQTGSKIDAKEIRSLTLKVTPQQQEKLFLGQNSGTLQLSLRNPEDGTEGNTNPATDEPPLDTVPVIIAADNIAINSNITEAMVKIQQFPKHLAPPSSLRSVEEVVGRLSSSTIAKGELLSIARLAAKGANQPIGLDIPLGKRAFTIQMSNVASSVAGFTQKGDKVDVLLSVKNKGAADGKRFTTTLLEDIKVLAVDQRVVRPADGKVDPKEVRSITLLVTPEQADTLAQNTGDLQLSLRNPEDSTLKAASTQAPAARLATTQPALIQTIRGVSSNYLELR